MCNFFIGLPRRSHFSYLVGFHPPLALWQISNFFLIIHKDYGEGIMRCTQTGCDGEITMHTSVPLQVGCMEYRSAYPCSKCGRLHWPGGHEVFNRGGSLVFLVDDHVEYRDPPKKNTFSPFSSFATI